ncbi:MAG: HupE/UreJ family protein [Pseudomonadota bacterium]
MRRLHTVILFSLLVVCSALAHAHKPSDSYLSLQVRDRQIDGQWDIALRDLDVAIGLDSDGDGALTWDEIRAKHADIGAYAMARLALSNGGAACPASVGEQLIDNHSDGAYAVLRFKAACSSKIEALDLQYKLLFDIDPQHKGLLKLESEGQTSTAIFTPDSALQNLPLMHASKLRQFVDYVQHGVWHIWIGFDHILFLLCLLLPSVLLLGTQKPTPQWQAAASFKAAFIDVLKIVTAFTLAHSLTLTLATLGVIALPSRWVESAIAASVILAALNNLFPLFQGRRWVAAFVFGLIHGFGFASVLSDLGLPPSSLLLALVGFNVGVEIGQLSIVGVFLPFAFALRHTTLYRKVLFTTGSSAIVVIAAVWLAERLFDLKLISA